jgi:hypothetical protein
MQSKEVNFEFKRSNDEWNIDYIKNNYQSTVQRWLEEVHNNKDEIKLEFINLNYVELNQDSLELVEVGKVNLMKKLFPYSHNYHIICNFVKGNTLFDFYIYGQNNCCGAMTTSKTYISSSFENTKLAHILQYLKEDISLHKSMYLMTCTDIYHTKVHDSDLSELKPYLPNTKVLLNTGWKVTKLFLNKNSNNVVALYIKDLVRGKLESTIKMKIKTTEGKLIKIENITVGTDPELFLRSKDTKSYVPSFFVIKGDKNNPTPISEHGHNIQCDNVMVEYGVPPSRTAEEYVKNNEFVLQYLKDKVCSQNNLELVIEPYVNFDENDLISDDATKFGCDPDFNVWLGGKPNTVGRPEKTGRCAGGHIHVGYDNHNYVTSNYIIKALDLFISVPLVLMEPNNKRKEMYGKAGSFRPQPWGVEYRSPSNFIISSPELMEWAFNQVLKAIDFVNDDNTRSMLDRHSYEIQTAINNKSLEHTKKLIKMFSISTLLEKKLVETI